MKAELTKAGKSITLYTPNVDTLSYEQAYGVPVRDDRGKIVGFVSDVDEKHIYMHIFDKETLDMEQTSSSFEIVSSESNFEAEPLSWEFTREDGRVVVTGNVKCNNHIFKYHISFYTNKNKKKGLNGGKIRTLRIWDDKENLLAYFDSSWHKETKTSEVEAIIKYFGEMW